MPTRRSSDCSRCRPAFPTPRRPARGARCAGCRWSLGLLDRRRLAAHRDPHHLRRARHRAAPRCALPVVHLPRGPRRGARGPAARRATRRPRPSPRPPTTCCWEYFPAVRRRPRRRPGRQPRQRPGRRQGGRRGRHRRRRGRRDDRLPGGRRSRRRLDRLHEDRRPGRLAGRQAGPAGWPLPWLGFVDPVVDVAPVAPRRTRPDRQRGVRHGLRGGQRIGSVDRPGRPVGPRQTAIARFFNGNPVSNSVALYRNALCDYLDAEPLGPAADHPAVRPDRRGRATAFIQTWRLKYEVGFWRPVQAIAGRCDRRQRRHRTRTPRLGAAGHQPAVLRLHQRPRGGDRAVRARSCASTLGDDTPLVLKGSGTQRRTPPSPRSSTTP